MADEPELVGVSAPDVVAALPPCPWGDEGACRLRVKMGTPEPQTWERVYARSGRRLSRGPSWHYARTECLTCEAWWTLNWKEGIGLGLAALGGGKPRPEPRETSE